MTPHDKAVQALNRRLERMQAGLRATKDEAAQQFLLQAVIVTLSLSEALSDYIKAVGAQARRRHSQLQETHHALSAQHSDLLKAGQEMLERLKANPSDRALRREIERTQQAMTSLQKSVRRGANALQREVAPSVGLIDPLADCVRRLSDADAADALPRVLKAVIGHVRALYAAQPARPSKDIIDAAAWEKSARSAVEQARGFDDAFARAGHQVLVALELMTLAVSEHPPRTAEEALESADAAVASRLKAITSRLTTM